jgi:acylphosphatase
MISLQVFYEGNVQGVGFRWTIRQISKGFDVIGWVRNLPDGRVEMQVGGVDSEVFAFLDAVTDSELRSHIDKQTQSALPEPVKARGFEIRHE